MLKTKGYAEPGKEDLVCSLKKSIYGLKQSPKCWNQKLDKCLKTLSFEKTIDPCVYVKENTKGALC